MASERNKYDGSLFGSSAGNSERGNTVNNKIPINKHASSKRSSRSSRKIESNSDLFGEEVDKDRYIITYADLITLLLGLFIILYAMSNIDNEKYRSAANALGSVFGGNKSSTVLVKSMPMLSVPQSPQKTLMSSLRNVISKNKFGKSIKLVKNKRGITIRIFDDILFASGQADVTNETQKVLSKLGPVMRKLPNDIRIEGHTDNVPIVSKKFPSNWHLSVARATNIAYYLMNTEKLSPDKVSIVGYSEYKPIASNETAEGRKLNRRVDIVILNKLK